MRPLLAIVGPTASGKSSLALYLAERIDGAVIVSADSRQIYRGLNIGTAKPTAEELAKVPHRLVDVVDPDQPFSLAAYQRQAYTAIDESKRPVLVGGTGLYIRAIVDGLTLPEAPPSDSLRSAGYSPAELLHQLQMLDPAKAAVIDTSNPRRLIRAIEQAGRPSPPANPRYQVLQIGLTAPRPVLYQRADERVDRMLAAGWLDEVRGLLRRYPSDLPAMSGLGYSELGAVLRDQLSLDQAAKAIKTRTHQLIKRQLTWFRRDARIQWFDISESGWHARAVEAAGTVWRLRY
ncbi:MAG: tRNA (adenosine(37)-N6)-dimethylallyltransferase MiaA [Chloroflexi bacterium]|nr:tRNA (adenosine(37)-N6)-dimethylallyltransferase MiaA [Chloroflexota bacterium]